MAVAGGGPGVRCLVTVAPGDTGFLNVVSLFTSACFPPRICPQSVCVRSIASLLREDDFGEAFALFPLAHLQGLVSVEG